MNDFVSQIKHQVNQLQQQGSVEDETKETIGATISTASKTLQLMVNQMLTRVKNDRKFTPTSKDIKDIASVISALSSIGSETAETGVPELSDSTEKFYEDTLNVHTDDPDNIDISQSLEQLSNDDINQLLDKQFDQQDLQNQELGD